MSSTTIATETVPKPVPTKQWLKRFTSHFLVRKIARALFTIWFVTSLIFFLVRLMPSNPIEVYINELIVQYSLTYAEARDQAASLFALERPNFPAGHAPP